MNDMNQRTLIIEITKGAVDTLFFYILQLQYLIEITVFFCWIV